MNFFSTPEASTKLSRLETCFYIWESTTLFSFMILHVKGTKQGGTVP